MKIPKYVREMVRLGQIRPAPLDEQAKVDDECGVYGYMFRIYRYSNGQHEGTFMSSVDRVVAWANREHASAVWHYFKWFDDKKHRKPYYKRDYALVTITDPVAQQLERLIKEGKSNDV